MSLVRCLNVLPVSENNGLAQHLLYRLYWDFFFSYFSRLFKCLFSTESVQMVLALDQYIIKQNELNKV